ncbi:hypothetical protein NOVOSPHI9U_50492 [Novosphingobium sp. 9U]|nr:hypothetical protein NOVOSPHI9U_50492 [Novosphingobium sp. 9U]
MGLSRALRLNSMLMGILVPATDGRQGRDACEAEALIEVAPNGASARRRSYAAPPFTKPPWSEISGLPFPTLHHKQRLGFSLWLYRQINLVHFLNGLKRFRV